MRSPIMQGSAQELVGPGLMAMSDMSLLWQWS